MDSKVTAISVSLKQNANRPFWRLNKPVDAFPADFSDAYVSPNYLPPVASETLLCNLFSFRCKKQYQTLDQYPLGSIFMCFEGNACRRTYLSERDLQAHFNHRHLPKSTAAPSATTAPATVSLPTTSSACGLVGVSMPAQPPPPPSTVTQGPPAGTAPPLQFPAPTSGLLSAAAASLAPHPATIYNQQAGAFLVPPSAAGSSATGPSAAPFQPNIPPPTHHGLGPPPQPMPPQPPRIPPLMSVVSGRGPPPPPPPLQQHQLGLNSATVAAVAAAQNSAAANMTAAFAVAAAMQQQAPSGLILDQMPVNALCQPPPRSLHPTAPMWPHTTSLSNLGQNRGPV
ncbi:hypothetical protein AAHC03_05617 [Spirometra sp. Aus1]